MKVSAHRIGVDPPPGWDVRIYRRAPDGSGETTHPVLHAATFGLPRVRGDFGSGAVTAMGTDHLFVSLLEYDAASAATPLFASRGIPRPDAHDFDPRQLQRTIAGQSGSQAFFHVGDRAFCLFVVLGSHARRARLVPRLHAFLDRVEIG